MMAAILAVLLVAGCTNSPTAQVCGNGKVEGTENCDDGNTINGDGCTGVCTTEQGYQCTGAPSVCTQI
jgi:cysteine-rich repeat protein